MKKTGFQKVLGRKTYNVIHMYEKLPKKQGEMQQWRTLSILDFTS